jgi:hypothetical protein
MADFPGAGGSTYFAVRTITQAGNNIWVGGVFDEIDDARLHGNQADKDRKLNRAEHLRAIPSIDPFRAFFLSRYRPPSRAAVRWCPRASRFSTRFSTAPALVGAGRHLRSGW